VAADVRERAHGGHYAAPWRCLDRSRAPPGGRGCVHPRRGGRRLAPDSGRARGHPAQPAEQVEALAAELGFLPLALAQAAAYITNEDIGVQQYRNLLATRLLHEVVPEEGELTDDHQRIISATWELSIDQADAARPAGLARPVLQLTSILDPAGIPQSVLSSPPALDHLATYLPGQGHMVDEETVDAALRVLHRYSLIDHDRALIYREVRVHQLVQRATRENLNAQVGLGPDLYAALAVTVADAILSLWPQIERDTLGRILYANTTALRDSAGAALWHQDDGAHQVLFRAANSLGDIGQVTAARTTWTDLVVTAQHRLGPDHPDTLTTRANLAYWRGEAGDAAGAAAAYEELLADELRVLGPDHPDTLATRANLALWRGEAGDAAGAAAAYEELLADELRVLGPDDSDTLTTRGNLARLRGLAGDAAGAVTAFQLLLADYLRVLGPDDPSPSPPAPTWRDCAAKRGTRRVRLPRSKSCWPTNCGYWALTTPTPSSPAATWRTGGAWRGMRRAQPPHTRSCCQTIGGYWAPTTPTPSPPAPTWRPAGAG
jgi:hypothetical protein